MEGVFNSDQIENIKLHDQIYSQRNRYIDILTYDKSRVRLVEGVDLKNSPESDYINACYVNSPLGIKKIIASQGPLPNTVKDFW